MYILASEVPEDKTLKAPASKLRALAADTLVVSPSSALIKPLTEAAQLKVPVELDHCKALALVQLVRPEPNSWEDEA